MDRVKQRVVRVDNASTYAHPGVYVATQMVTPALMGHQSEIEGKQREQQLHDSGAPLAATTSGGRVGILSFRRAQLRIVVFPGGILLKPWLVRSYAVLTSEITRLRIKRSFVGDQHIEITCASAPMRSPVTLYVSPGSDTARAIEHITGMVLALE
jgi:hypothetical protein